MQKEDEIRNGLPLLDLLLDYAWLRRILFIILLILLTLLLIGMFRDEEKKVKTEQVKIELPAPGLKGDVSVEEAIFFRRSIRSYARDSMTLKEISQLLWAAQGITSVDGKRSVPSAGATYPLEIYVVTGKISGLGNGVYRYLPSEHALDKIADDDRRKKLLMSALIQPALYESPALLIISAKMEKTEKKYGSRGERYVYMEAGHAAQNIYLQAFALNIGTTVIGAFHDAKVNEILGFGEDERPLYIMPVGKTK